MPARKSRLLKVGALVPLAAVSVAWTASMAGVGGPALVVAERQAPAPAQLPDGTAIPEQALDAPASVTGEDGLLGTGSADATQVVSSASASGIPSAALAAYQRAESVINAADTSCRLPWQLIAAIGRVESNHGRANGNVLGDDGLASPGIYGVPLDGSGGTRAISDTDAGQYDSDTTHDRAVGPLQFIPSTWSVVGVDADGDGQRNPQDVDDAALAAAVYLCSGEDDLSAEPGQRASVYRYNNSESYVDLVLSVMQAYMSGDFTTIPNSTVAAGILTPSEPMTGGFPGGEKKAGKKKSTKKVITDEPEVPSTPETRAPEPTAEPKPTAKPTSEPTKKADDTKKDGIKVPVPNAPSVTLPPLPTTGVEPVDQVLTRTEALAQCVLDLPQLNLQNTNLTVLLGLLDLNPNSDLAKCVTGYTTP